MYLLGIVAILYGLWEIISTALTKPLPPVENRELYEKDMYSGMSTKQLLKNQAMGKYSLPRDRRK